MTTHFKNLLSKRELAGNLRELKIVQTRIDFASNDYLGLASSSDLAQRLKQEWNDCLGSTGSRLLTGNSFYAQNLEDHIAQFHGYEAGLLFNCGYMANMAILATIPKQEDTIFFDSNVHASMRTGVALSQAQAFAFRHHDLEHLKKRLKNRSGYGECFICITSICSTNGSSAPLVDICQLAKDYQAHVIVDEAHAVGIFGPQGKGLVAQSQLCSQVFAQVTTFGKALGAHGAIILGNHVLKKALVNFASPFIYTTALPFYSLAAIKCSYDLFPTLEKERKHLVRLIEICKHVGLSASNSAIQSIPIKSNHAAIHLSQHMQKLGFDVRALLSPTVRQGDEMLRICLHAFNTEDELIKLLNSLKEELTCLKS